MTGPIHWARGLTRLPFIGTRQRPSPKGVRCQRSRRARRHRGRAELPPNPARIPDRASDRPNDSVSGLTCQCAAPLGLADRGTPASLRACRSTPRLSNAFLAGSAPPTCSGRPSPSTVPPTQAAQRRHIHQRRLTQTGTGWPRLPWEQPFEQMRYRMTAVSGTAMKAAGAPRNTAAAQIKAQRRRYGTCQGRYASAVLHSLSRTYAGRPAHEVQRVLANSTRPLGVRVNARTLHQLAMEIAAGRPVELP